VKALPRLQQAAAHFCHASWASLRTAGKAAQVIRGIILLLFWPLLQRWGYGITARDGIVLAWSGLRGAARAHNPAHPAAWTCVCTVMEHLGIMSILHG
jgi:hypothetical protein